MITANHANEERDNCKKIIFDDNKSVNEKFKALYKLLEIVIKISLSSRFNQVKMMEAMDISKKDGGK